MVLLLHQPPLLPTMFSCPGGPKYTLWESFLPTVNLCGYLESPSSTSSFASSIPATSENPDFGLIGKYTGWILSIFLQDLSAVNVKKKYEKAQ